jgi:hypothetical protein
VTIAKIATGSVPNTKAEHRGGRLPGRTERVPLCVKGSCGVAFRVVVGWSLTEHWLTVSRMICSTVSRHPGV